MESIIKSILREFIEQQEKKSVVVESGLNRIYNYVKNHECAIITAYRHKLVNCVNNDSGETLHFKGNNERNKQLKATLLTLGYGVTPVKGTYVENYLQSNAIEVNENSFFVVNLKNDSNFIDNIKEMGEIFCQDSVLLITDGGKNVSLFGTNNSDFPGYGNSIKQGHFKPGIEGEFMTKVKGRPIVFETFNTLQNNTKRLVKEYAKPIMRRLNHGK